MKKAQAVVVDPVTIEPKATLREAQELIHSKGFSGLPVIQDGRPVGILTNRDIRFESNDLTSVSDLMTTDLITVSEGISLGESKRLLQRHRIEKLLVTDAQGLLRGLITSRDIERAELHPNASTDALGRLLLPQQLAWEGIVTNAQADWWMRALT